MTDISELFIDLVKIDSPTGEERFLAAYLQELLLKEELVDSVEVDEHGNLFARKKGLGEPVLLVAHLDTVEPGRGIKPLKKDGYITSDGKTILGADNKAAVAAIVHVLRQLKEGKSAHTNLELLFSVAEESGISGVSRFKRSNVKAKYGFCFDFSHPVGTVVIASPFYEKFALKIIGKEAHASHPEEGTNALISLRDLLVSLKLGRVNSEVMVNIGKLSGGYAVNTVVGEVVLEGEIRSLTEKSLNKYKKEFEKKLKKIGRNNKTKLEIEFVRENPGYFHKNKEASKILEQVKKAVLNLNLNYQEQIHWSVSDANILNEMGIICLNLADGTQMPHTKSERIKQFELQNLAALIGQLSGG